MLTEAYAAIREYTKLDEITADHGENSPEAEHQRRVCRRAIARQKATRVNGRRTIAVTNGYHYRTTEDGTLIRTKLTEGHA